MLPLLRALLLSNVFDCVAKCELGQLCEGFVTSLTKLGVIPSETWFPVYPSTLLVAFHELKANIQCERQVEQRTPSECIAYDSLLLR